MAKEKSVPLNPMQSEYLKGILTARAQIERDYQTAAGAILAGHGVDLPQGAQFRYEGDKLVYTVSDEAPAE